MVSGLFCRVSRWFLVCVVVFMHLCSRGSEFVEWGSGVLDLCHRVSG